MSAVIVHVIAWRTLVCALLVWGFTPGAVLRLIVLLYRRDDPRRPELLSELYNVPRIERPFWVAEVFGVALFEGLGGRLAYWRTRRMVAAFFHVRLDGRDWTVELRISAELKRVGVPAEQLMEGLSLALETGSAKWVRTVPGILPVTPWFTMEQRPRQDAARAVLLL
jgi:hypothetical protein